MKKIKYVGMLLVALLMGTQMMNAQNQNGQPGKGFKGKRMTAEQMVEMQSNRIIQELGLDDNTAAKFSEVYKKYMTELRDVQKKGMDFRGKKPDGEAKERKAPTDAEVEKMIKERFAQSRKMLDIREKYYDEFRKFLSPKQIQKIYDQGQMNRGKFHKEMNRREGMKKKEGRPAPQMPPQPKEQE